MVSSSWSCSPLARVWTAVSCLQELSEELGYCGGEGFSFLPDVDYFQACDSRDAQCLCHIFTQVAQALFILTAYAYAAFLAGDVFGGKDLIVPITVCGAAIFFVPYWLPAAPLLGKWAAHMVAIQAYLTLACVVIYFNTAVVYDMLTFSITYMM
jgi:hypothetical protein